MSDEDVIRRLRAFGEHPVDPDVAFRHRSVIASVPVVPPRRSRLRPALAGTFLAGTLLGGMGLAGALPRQASDVAKNVLQTVGLADDDDDRERGKADDHDDAGDAERRAAGTTGAHEDNGTERFTTGCANSDGTQFSGTHGDWVSSHPDNPDTPAVNERAEAAKSDCGKPLTSVQNRQEAEARKADRSGRPADAGRIDDDEDDDRDDDDHGRPAGAGQPDGRGGANSGPDSDDDDHRDSGRSPRSGPSESSGRGSSGGAVTTSTSPASTSSTTASSSTTSTSSTTTTTTA